MPELPEVETVARQLAPVLVGRKARCLRVFDRKLAAAERPDLRGAAVRAVVRTGKRVLIEFGPSDGNVGPAWLAVHLRMSGRLFWEPGATVAAPRAHERAALDLDGGAVRLVDPRRFGTLTWLGSKDEGAESGIDPMTPAFTPASLAALLDGSRQKMKAWLLRQDRLVGLGNIYASEILFRARISPFKAAGRLDTGAIGRLHEATVSILGRAIEHCGTTFSDFQDAHGTTGGFQQFLQVYGRAGEPCPRCGRSIRRVVQQQRSTYYCAPCTRPHRGAATKKEEAGTVRP